MAAALLLPFLELSHFRTKRVVYQDAFKAEDSSTLEHLRELTVVRAAIELALDGRRPTGAVAKEMHGVDAPTLQDIQKVEAYLPLLVSFIGEFQKFIKEAAKASASALVRTGDTDAVVLPTSVDAEAADCDGGGEGGSVARLEEELLLIEGQDWAARLAIRWTSPLTRAGVIAVPKFFRVDDIAYEHAVVLQLYGALLRQRAMEVMGQDIVEASNLLRRAAGVYAYVAESILPLHKSTAMAHGEMPPEAISSTPQALILVCLGEAQALAAFRAEERGSKPTLLAKLHEGVADKFRSAHGLLTGSKPQCQPLRDSSVRFSSYVPVMAALHSCRAKLYLAEELQQKEEIGVAVGLLKLASEEFQQGMRSAGGSLSPLLLIVVLLESF
eukprot:TRINITY_DN3865_c0_g1_i2.p1 TRINITY_DN3865_c0_g1~~TRINITY_DN3865_c0_g1_i2.p1  ORF type:complete len:400 (+),score=114.75 TRINITY_DN3865_c0_g1_i2:47-1201(+)